MSNRNERMNELVKIQKQFSTERSGQKMSTNQNQIKTKNEINLIKQQRIKEVQC